VAAGAGASAIGETIAHGGGPRARGTVAVNVASTRRIHFNNLPPALRTRLRDYLKARQAVLARPRATSAGGVVAALIVSVILGGLAIHLLRRGFGDPTSAAYQLAPAMIPFLALGLLFPLAVLFAGLANLVTPPFPLGVYVLATDLLDARTPVLKLTPLASLRQAIELPRSWSLADAIVDRLLELPTGGMPRAVFRVGGHVFTIDDQWRAQEAVRALARNAKACAADDGAYLQHHDLFRSIRGQTWSARAVGTPTEGPVVSWASRVAAVAPLLAVVVALAVAPALWAWRNARSVAAATASSSR
jgi:hypothetical protein